MVSLQEWQEIYNLCKQQSLIGVFAEALKHANVRPTDDDNERNADAFEDLLMTWMGDASSIERLNAKVSANVVQVVNLFQKKGFEACLLKGQGNALMYPNDSIRISGDIDVWVRPKGKRVGEGNSVRDIVRFIKSIKPDAKATYHHIDCVPCNGTEVEVHYRPQFLFDFRHNRNLQNFFYQWEDKQFSHTVSLGEGEVAVPTPSFNIVFQLSHIYNHLFHEGIGLRQVMDYYYNLKVYKQECDSDTNLPEFTKNWDKTFSGLGLRGIAGAIMWILIYKFGMSAQWAIVVPDEKRGRFVFNEIMHGGNFGKYDDRYQFGKGVIGKNFQRLYRDFRLFSLFPSESLSEPFFRMYHALWRLRYNR
ncbi:MAG: nucleotidyltransferase family protein [Prevotella sp.]|nr:nucleotidyltransferase family protein [Prevotella sp.]